MEDLHLDLSALGKAELLEIAIRCQLISDTEENCSHRSRWYLNLITESIDKQLVSNSIINAVIDELVAEGMLDIAEEEETEVETKPQTKKENEMTTQTDIQAAAALLNLLKSNATVDVDMVKQIVNEALANIEPQRVFITPLGVEIKGEQHYHASFDKTLRLASVRQNILIVGPAGCGKTKMAHQVADALSLPFGMISCSAGMSENQLTGWLLPTGDNGRFEYNPSGFVKAYENGGVFLLDEIDAADENTLLVINAALANGHMSIPQRTDKPIALRHPDFVVIAAANTFGHGADMVYAGRNKLDGATLDRFRAGVVKMDYDTKMEKKLVDSEVLEWCLDVRRKINELRLRRVMSTRVMLDFTKQKTQLDMTLDDFKESYFSDWTKDELSKIN